MLQILSLIFSTFLDLMSAFFFVAFFLEASGFDSSKSSRSLTVIEPENETSWNRGFSDFNENRHKDGNLGLHDYEGQQKVIFFNFGKISISG